LTAIEIGIENKRQCQKIKDSEREREKKIEHVSIEGRISCLLKRK